MQVVEEKQLEGRDSIHYSVADAVEDDALDAEQDPSASHEELVAISDRGAGARFESFAHYMKHLNDPISHNELMQDISNHLWMTSRIQKAKNKLDNFKQLLDIF